MLVIAFITLGVLVALFGLCLYVFIRSNRNTVGGDDALYDDERRADEKTETEAEAESAAPVEMPDVSQTRKIELPSEKIAEPTPAPEAEVEHKSGDTNAFTDAELLSLKNTAHEAPAADEDNKPSRLVPALIAGAAAVLAVLFVVAFALVRNEANSSTGEVEAPETVTATISNIRQQESFDGTIESNNLETVTFAANGKITDVRVSEGDYVKKGAVIYTIDSSTIEERIALLKDKKETLTVTEEKTVNDDSEITAYTDGTVTKIYVSEGDEVGEKIPVAEISDTTGYKAVLTFPADAEKDLSEATASSVEVISGSSTYSGTVASVSPGSDSVKATITFTVDDGKVPSTVTATINGKSSSAALASANNRSSAIVFANASGKIKSINLREGDSVKSGDSIATLTTEKTVNETTTDELAAKDIDLQIEQLETELANYTVKASSSGRVKKLYKKEGENAAVNVQAVSIVPDGSLRLVVPVTKDKAENLAVPAAAEFKVKKSSGFDDDVWDNDALDETHSIILSSLMQYEDGSSEYEGVIEDDEAYRDGMKAEVNVVTYSAYDALLLPENLVKNGKVKVWRANKVEEIEVETGITTDDGYVEILSGLSSVDKVVVE